MMSLWDALRMNMMISYQELVRTFLNTPPLSAFSALLFFSTGKQLLIEHVKKDSHIGVFPRR